MNSEPEITQLDATGVHAYWAPSRETCGDGKGSTAAGRDNQRTQLMATATSIHPYNHLHSLTAFPCTPHLSPFRILSHTLHNTVSDQTQALLHNSQNTLLPASPSAASMTPVSEHQQPKEPGTQAATSHHAPAVPSKSMLFLHMYRTVDHESCIVSS